MFYVFIVHTQKRDSKQYISRVYISQLYHEIQCYMVVNLIWTSESGVNSIYKFEWSKLRSRQDVNNITSSSKTNSRGNKIYYII